MSSTADEGLAQTCSERIAQPSYGIGIDMNGHVWVPQHFSGILREYSPDGPLLNAFDMQMSYNRGVAVTPVDNHIWVAHTGEDDTDNRVTRYANNGDLCEVIFLPGYGPSALAVDADGYVWVTMMGIAVAGQPALPAIARISPADVIDLPAPCGTDSLASTVVPYDIDQLEGGEDHPGGEAKPYDYSDMTGMVTLQTSATGTWTTVHDGGVYDAVWNKVILNAGVGCSTGPLDSRFEVDVRAADSQAGLPGAPYQTGVPVDDEVDYFSIANVWGRFVQVRVRFHGSCEVGANFATPVLCELQVEGDDVRDCNHNNEPDDADILAEPTIDCNDNGIPDECEIDRNSEAFGTFFCRGFCDPDCNDNGIPDACDIAYCMGDPGCEDCDLNGVPDSCDPDCNENDIPDGCDIDGMVSEDCDENGIPDECQNLVIGACCTAEDVCEDGSKKGCCESEGGQFLGIEILCDSDPDRCGVGACCDDGSCTDEDVVTCGSGPEITFLGYGTTCDQNCCPQTETGDDDCGSVAVAEIFLPGECRDDFGSVLEPPDPCYPANGVADCPPEGTVGWPFTCEASFGISTTLSLSGNTSGATGDDCGNLEGERVWWEAFSVDDCGVVTMDFYCTDPAVTTFHTVVYEDCACALGIRADAIDVDEVGGENPTLTWTLAAGTYYYPILAGENGISGPYEIHFEAERCSIGTCCFGDGPVPCTLVDRRSCEASDGVWRGGGDQPILNCQVGACETGSCYTNSNGSCNDDENHNTEELCEDPDHPDAYTFVPVYSCPEVIICGITAASQCKESGGDMFVLSDLGACVRVADDFTPDGGAIIDQVCWRGAYHDFAGEPAGATQISTTLEPATLADCSGAYGDDRFTITIYDEVDGMPGTVLLSASVSAAGGGLYGTALELGSPIYDYSAPLSNPLSITIGTSYWLEIQNDNGGDGSCYWMWESSRQAFNSVSARDDDNNWEIGDVQLSTDQSMCLGGSGTSLDPFDGTVIMGACCSDVTGRCLDGVAIYDCVGAFDSSHDCGSSEMEMACSFACCEYLGGCNDRTFDECESVGGFLTPGLVCGDGPLCAGVCGQGTRCCYEEDAGLGCGDPGCCTTVCVWDPYCCETEWDSVCVGEAFDLCDATEMDECLESPLSDPMTCSDDSDCDGSPNSCQDGFCPCLEDDDCLSESKCDQGRCYIPKNRYLSFQPNNLGEVALQVVMAVSEQFDECTPLTSWVEAPINGISRMGNSPVTRRWTETVVHVSDEEIVPASTYQIRATHDGGSTFSTELVIQSTPRPGVKRWGDAVGFFDGTEWTPPNGAANIDDAVAAIKTFQDPNADNATHFSITDIDGLDDDGVVNGIVNIQDVFMFIRAFHGECYPYKIPLEAGGECAGGCDKSLPGNPSPSTLSLVASSDPVKQGELFNVDVFIDEADNLGGYQLALEVTDGDAGSLDLAGRVIDTMRTDYVFYGVDIHKFTDDVGGHVAAVRRDGEGDPVILPPSYLGTFQFLASADALGVFNISFESDYENFLLNGEGTRLTNTMTIAVPVTVLCDDDNPCTADLLQNGVCAHTNEPVGTSCDDGLFCTGTDECDGSGTCVSSGSPCGSRHPYCCEYLSTCGPQPCS